MKLILLIWPILMFHNNCEKDTLRILLSDYNTKIIKSFNVMPNGTIEVPLDSFDKWYIWKVSKVDSNGYTTPHNYNDGKFDDRYFIKNGITYWCPDSLDLMNYHMYCDPETP